MIFQMLHLLMMIMMVNSVISAPGQMDAINDMSRTRKHKPRPMPSGTLDSLGGGNILRTDSLDPKENNFRSLELLVSYQDDIPQNMVLVAREAKQKPSSSGTLDSIGGGNLVRIVDSAREAKQNLSSSGTLDPIGGGNLVRIVDSDIETEIYRSLESLLENQDDIYQNMFSLLRKEKQKHSTSGTLDSIGGGHLLGIADPDVETEIFRLLVPSLENQDSNLQNTVSLVREKKQKPSSPGTLDPLGGNNLVKVVDPGVDVEFFRSFKLLLDNQGNMIRKMVSVSREDKQKPSSSGTLDPIGGGNLVRIVDPESETEIFRSLKSLIDNQGRQNMMRLAREDKSSQRSSSHALDGLGGGLAGPYRGQILQSHLTDSLDQGGDVMKMLDSISGSDLLSSLDSAEGMAVLSALRKTHTKYPKRMLDSVSGWAFGQSKRNFDEIDNVGFTGFAKRSPRYRQLALAKKNFDEIDRAGFETYNKRDFDEIDRAGFETFEKRDRKD